MPSYEKYKIKKASKKYYKFAVININRKYELWM